MRTRWPLALMLSIGLHGGAGAALLALRGQSDRLGAPRSPLGGSLVEVELTSRRPSAEGSGGQPTESKRVSREQIRPGVVEKARPVQPAQSEHRPASVSQSAVEETMVGEAGQDLLDGALPGGEGRNSDDDEARDGVSGAARGATDQASGSSNDGVRQDVDGAASALVHQRLAQSAERCYPPAARRFGQRGEVLVSFCVAPDGRARDTELRGSTGSPLLDAAAVECVVVAAAPFPREATGACFTAPIRFGRSIAGSP